MALPDPTAVPARGSWRILSDPVFGPFFAGRVISTTGIWIASIVSAILAFELSGSALTVGLVSAAQFGPQLLFAPLSGAIADRGHRKLQMVAGRVIIALGSGGLALTVWRLGVDGLPGAWVVIVAAAVVGMGFVAGGPAMSALVPSLVRRQELDTAIALDSLPFSLGRAAGPAIGAFVATTAGPAFALGIASGANMLFALVVVFLPIAPWKPEHGKDRRVRAGLTFVRRNPTLIRLLVGIAAIGIGTDPVLTLSPSLADDLGANVSFPGVLASAFGVGAVIAIFVMSAARHRFGVRRLGIAGLGVLAFGLLGAAASPSRAAVVIALGIGGAGMTTALANLSTQLQTDLPEEYRGRVMGIWALAFLGSRPMAAAVNGFVSDATSPRIGFAFAALVVVGIAMWVRATPVTAGSP